MNTHDGVREYLDLIPGIGNSERAVLLNNLINTLSNWSGLLRSHSGVYFPEIGCTFSWEMSNYLCFQSSSYFSYASGPHRHPFALILIALGRFSLSFRSRCVLGLMGSGLFVCLGRGFLLHKYFIIFLLYYSCKLGWLFVRPVRSGRWTEMNGPKIEMLFGTNLIKVIL